MYMSPCIPGVSVCVYVCDGKQLDTQLTTECV